MKRIFNLIFIFSLSSSTVNALELGQLQVESYLNEPLNASFSVDNIDGNHVKDIILSVASQDAYSALGLNRPHFLTKVKFTISPGQDTQHIAHMTTRQRIREPILDILVKVTEKHSSLTRLYTLILDPRSIGETTKKKQILNHVQVVNSATEDSVRIQTKRSGPAGNNRIVVNNQSISIIAQNSYLHEKYSVYQIMRAFYLENSSAFNQGNINHLLSGSSLRIPQESVINEVSRQKAINFVYAVSKNNPNIAESPTTHKKVDLTETLAPVLKQTADVKPAEKSQPNSSVKHEKLVKAESQNTQGMPGNENIWRSINDEFRSLSNIVETQNGVVKVQGNVLQKINEKLESQNQHIEQLYRRLDGVESNIDLNSGNLKINDESIANGAESDISSLQRQYNTELKSLNVNQANVIAEINTLKQRLYALEQQASLATIESIAEPVEQDVPLAIEKPVNLITSIGSIKISRNWIFLLLAVALLILGGREWIWRTRLKALTSSRNNIPADDTAENDKIEIVELEDNQIESADESLNQAVKDSAQQAGESNLERADQKFENAVSNAREFKLEPDVLGQQTEENEKLAAESLYAEIDVLIAYQLYEEGLELLQSTRKTMPGNHCLDIRELEILAYTKNVDLFFPMFEQQKNTLSIEFPEEWKKLQALNDQLVSEFKMTGSV